MTPESRSSPPSQPSSPSQTSPQSTKRPNNTPDSTDSNNTNADFNNHASTINDNTTLSENSSPTPNTTPSPSPSHSHSRTQSSSPPPRCPTPSPSRSSSPSRQRQRQRQRNADLSTTRGIRGSPRPKPNNNNSSATTGSATTTSIASAASAPTTTTDPKPLLPSNTTASRKPFNPVPKSISIPSSPAALVALPVSAPNPVAAPAAVAAPAPSIDRNSAPCYNSSIVSPAVPPAVVPDLHLPSTQRAASQLDYPQASGTSSRAPGTPTLAQTSAAYFSDAYYSHKPDASTQYTYIPQAQPQPSHSYVPFVPQIDTIAPRHAPPPGLFNLGNTCYLNSVLQVLYHIPAFRSAILEWPGLPLCLQTEPLLFAADLVSALRLVFEALDRAQHRADNVYLQHLTRREAQNNEGSMSFEQQLHHYTPSIDTFPERPRFGPACGPKPAHGTSNLPLVSAALPDNPQLGPIPSTVTPAVDSAVTTSVLRGPSGTDTGEMSIGMDFDLDEEDEDDDDWHGDEEDDEDDEDDEEDDEDEEDEEDEYTATKEGVIQDAPQHSKPHKSLSSDSVLYESTSNGTASEPAVSLPTDRTQIDCNVNSVANVASAAQSRQRTGNELSVPSSAYAPVTTQSPALGQDHGQAVNPGLPDPRTDLPDVDLREGMDYVEPHDMISLLRNEQRCLEFDARGQQDAHEFLRFLLDKVKDCMRARAKYEKEQAEIEEERQWLECEHENREHERRKARELERELERDHDRDSERESELERAIVDPEASSKSTVKVAKVERERKRRKTCSDSDEFSSKSAENCRKSTRKSAVEKLKEKEKVGVTTRRGAKLMERSKDVHSSNYNTNSTSRSGSRPKRRRSEIAVEKDQGCNECKRNEKDNSKNNRPGRGKDKAMVDGSNPNTSKREENASEANTDEGAKREKRRREEEKESREELSEKFPKEESKEGEDKKEEIRQDLIEQLFGGKAVTMTRCEECEKITERWEEYLDISLPVKAEKSLAWALSSHGQAEQLCGDNKYMCDGCHTYCEAKRWLKLSALPKVLTVHLKLFAFDGGGGGGSFGLGGNGGIGGGTELAGCSSTSGAKVSVAMPCPVRFKLSEWCSADCPQRDDEYRLTGVIVHEGTGASSGHYYSFVLKGDQGTNKNNSDEGNGNDNGWWYCCDDSVVTAISEDEMSSMLFTSMRTRRTAYVLFYTHCA